MSYNRYNPWERHQCNPWALLIGVGLMGLMVLMFFGGTIAVETHKLATQNQIEEVRMNAEMKQLGRGGITHEVK